MFWELPECILEESTWQILYVQTEVKEIFREVSEEYPSMFLGHILKGI
jgi:hypothetical protein